MFFGLAVGTSERCEGNFLDPNLTAREKTETQKEVEYLLSATIEVPPAAERIFLDALKIIMAPVSIRRVSHGFKRLLAPFTACGNHKDFLFEVLTTSGLHPILV
jgi:hypothetical protein